MGVMTGHKALIRCDFLIFLCSFPRFVIRVVPFIEYFFKGYVVVAPIQNLLAQFRSDYTETLALVHPELVRKIELWELTEDDLRVLGRFAGLSEQNRVCLGLYFARYSPRKSFSRQRGYHLLEKAIEDRFLRDDPGREAFVQGVLSFVRSDAAAFVRLYQAAKSWQVVRNAFAKKSA